MFHFHFNFLNSQIDPRDFLGNRQNNNYTIKSLPVHHMIVFLGIKRSYMYNYSNRILKF